MARLVLVSQIVLPFGLFNVWLLRPRPRTAWRGGKAQNIPQEFASYGLPDWFMGLIGFFKLSLAALLLVGIWLPPATNRRPWATAF
jgi:hypothetical protein